jgi:hypothetical protein
LPAIKDIKRINQSIAVELTDMEKKYKRSQLMKKVLRDFEQFKPTEKKFDSVFVVAGEELTLITTLEKIAGDLNLALDIELNQPIAKNQIYDATPLKMKISGDLISTLKFLDKLSKLTFSYNISSVYINRDDKNKSVVTVFSGEVYSLSANN